MNWYLHVWKNYATFDGRATRSEYWYFILFNTIISIALLIIDEIATGGILSIVYLLAILIPSIAVATRRLHDINKSGWWQLIALIPLIGLIVLIVFYCTDSKEDNQYGVNPKIDNSTNITKNDDFSQLEKLSELKDKGIITQEEFDAKKKQIIG